MRRERDLRVDFFRGVALLTILWNHLNINALNTGPFFFKLTPTHLGISSAADTFVFLSGIVYERVIGERGMALGYAKSLNRAWQLYVANIVTLLLLLCVCFFFKSYGGVDLASI